MSSPIIFIHKGNSDYLKYTLQSAKKFNPQKRIILLGDTTNDHYTYLNIEHFYFADYASGKEIEEFNNVFEFIAGKNHKKEEWVKFVFQRWYHMFNFIVHNKIQQFWTFDSDTIILTDLLHQEKKFNDFDCTEQCSGMCMNGFISKSDIVRGYIEKMNELFQRKEYLEKQRLYFEKKPEYAYTEMRAYKTYKLENHIKSIHLKTIINNETFDDCICLDDDMETYEVLLNNRKLKKIFACNDGNLYNYHLPTQEYVKLNSLNMSWVPTYLYKRFINLTHNTIGLSQGMNIFNKTYKEVSIMPPLSVKLQMYFNNTKARANRIKNIIVEKF